MLSACSWALLVVDWLAGGSCEEGNDDYAGIKTDTSHSFSAYFYWVTSETACGVVVEGYLCSFGRDSGCVAYRLAQGKNKVRKSGVDRAITFWATGYW